MHAVRSAALVIALTATVTACGATPSSDATDAAPPTTLQAAMPPTTTPLATAPPTTTAPAATPPSTTAPLTTAPLTTLPPIVFPTGVDPVRIEIPAIGVDAATVDLSLGGASPEVPADFDDVGWYQQTRKPGELGPAVLAGHVDSTSGPAVFYRLHDLDPGDEITVYGADGDRRTFEVVSQGQYSKGELPDEVFAFGDGDPELRLITCGGDFDRSIGHYEDNIVVYARMVTA